VLPLPCKLPLEYFFGLRDNALLVAGAVLDVEFDEVQDEAEVSGSSAMELDNMGREPDSCAHTRCISLQ